MRRSRPQAEVSALDLLEEAVAMLRRQPVSTWAVYYVGTIPCVLGWLFYWADMSRAAGARERLVGGAFWLAVLFLGMKVSQLVLVRRLRSFLMGHPVEAWTAGEWVRAVGLQAAIQPWRLLVLPVAALLAVPWPWCLAFFENLTVVGAGRIEGGGSVVRRAWAQACIWPGQNQVLCLVLLLVSGVVWLNVILVMVQAPQLLKSLLGLETVFTRSPWAYLNSTFLAVSGALTFLCVDPIVKTLFVLRCFYGESLRTGEDLRSGFARLRRRLAATGGGTTLLILALTTFGWSASAAESAEVGAGSEGEVESGEGFERAVETVMRRPLFEWRFPREAPTATPETGSALGRWIQEGLTDLRETMKRLRERMTGFFRGVGDLLEALGRRVFGRGWRPTTPGVSMDLAGGLQLLFWLALVLALVAASVWGWRSWLKRTSEPGEVTAGPDLVHGLTEAISAAERPQDDWMRLAEELLARGERRLALRALYLASLAGLAHAGWIHLARYKSNRDYAAELKRRVPGLPDIPEAFGRMLSCVEPVWYGSREASSELLEEVREHLERMRRCGALTQAG